MDPDIVFEQHPMLHNQPPILPDLPAPSSSAQGQNGLDVVVTTYSDNPNSTVKGDTVLISFRLPQFLQSLSDFAIAGNLPKRSKIISPTEAIARFDRDVRGLAWDGAIAGREVYGTVFVLPSTPKMPPADAIRPRNFEDISL